MKRLKGIAVAAGAGVVLSGMAVAVPEAAQNFQVKNRLRVGWDNNVYEEKSGEDRDQSYKIIEELEFLLNLDMEQTFLGLRYRPTFVWWSDREPDDTDFHHEADVVLTHTFTPRVTFNLKNSTRIAEIPELIDRGVKVRENDDYTYNLADAVLAYRLSQATRFELGGRYTLLRYDNENVAKTDDYDIYAVGLTVRHMLQKETTLSADIRYEQTEYVELDVRSSESVFYGAGLEQIFSPNLVGSVRGGLQTKSFEASEAGDETNPFADAALTLLPSPKTRISLGTGYSMFEADVYPFASQDRWLTYVSISHDLTARVQLFLASSYQLSQYNADQRVEDVSYKKKDGDEEILQLSGRVSYMINRRNYLELSVQYLDFTTDLRDEFDRTRVEVGWRTQL